MTSLHRQMVLNAVDKALLDHPTIPQQSTKPRPTQKDVGQNPWPRLESELEALSARLHLVRDPKDVQQTLKSIIDQYSATKAALWEHRLLEELELPVMLAAYGLEIIKPHTLGQQAIEAAATCDLGITSAELVMTDTGAVVVKAGLNMPRSASLTPPVHVVIIEKKHLSPDLDGLIDHLRGLINTDTRLPSAIHIITGPSRTADIELTLTLGVHGPKAVHVIGIDR